MCAHTSALNKSVRVLKESALNKYAEVRVKARVMVGLISTLQVRRSHK